jgi:GTP-binding protein
MPIIMHMHTFFMLGKSKHGRKGKDTIREVPCGTIVKEVVRTNGEEMCMPVCDLDVHVKTIVVAKGGEPGLGNCLLRGKFLRNSPRRMPTQKTKSTPGDIRFLELELKTIANVGLVGYPNAGKSTFLSQVSRAKPKIAPYPFTTLHPNVGHVEFQDHSRMTIADIPGLIEGAHRNVGLGHKFLRHIERTQVLLYVIDSTGESPWTDFEMLQRELELYAPNLTSRPSLVLANKVDAGDVQTNLAILREKASLPVIAASALTGHNMDQVINSLRLLVDGALKN